MATMITGSKAKRRVNKRITHCGNLMWRKPSIEIEEKLLVLSENDKGWTKELNRVSFNGAPAKYDIRTWSPDHTKMGKGITLSNEEFQVLVDAFKN